MNEMYLTIGAIAMISIVFALFGVYVMHGRQNVSLCNAKVGEVFDFEYLQPLDGDAKRWKAKVIEPVVHLDNTAIQRMNARSNYRRHDIAFRRTNHLVTCQTADGKIRQFYCERVKNCRKPLLASLFT